MKRYLTPPPRGAHTSPIRRPWVGIEGQGQGQLGVRECAIIDLDTYIRLESFAGNQCALRIGNPI